MVSWTQKHVASCVNIHSFLKDKMHTMVALIAI